MEWKEVVAAHPLAGLPYDKLKYVHLDQNRVPIYAVEGCDDAPAGAYTALGRAFKKHGGLCFYCSKSFKPQPLRKNGPHRDHVIAKCHRGPDLLHNLVIACARCGRDKGCSDIIEFRHESGAKYLRALAAHLDQCLRSLRP
jgi:5-methylcytosine-specific restriction endonuclease McrA